MVNPNISAFDGNRLEIRYSGTDDPQTILPEHVSELCYPDSVTTSIYLGSVPEELVPDRGAARLRFRSSDVLPHDTNVCVLDPTQPAALELKLHSQKDIGIAGSERTRKYSIAGMALGSALEALRSPQNFTALEKYGRGSHFPRFLHLLYQGSGLRPVMMLQAHRRHFVVSDPELPLARITLDSGTSFWRAGDDGVEHNVLYAARLGTYAPNKVEVKRQGDTTDPGVGRALMEMVFGTSDYLPDTHSKREIAQTFAAGVNLQRPVLNNPGIVHGDVYPEFMKEFDEREIKIDVCTDPREIVANMSIDRGENLYLGQPIPYEVFLRYIRVAGKTFVEKSYNEDFAPAVFRHKTPGSLEEGVLVRSERTFFSESELLAAMGLEISPDQLRKDCTATAIRSKISRYAIFQDTGNFFVILADHCVANDREPLDQLEIEYQGRLGFTEQEDAARREQSIAADFQRLNRILRRSLEEKGITALPSQTTKEAWLTA